MSANGRQLPPGWVEATIADLFAQLEDGRTLHQGWSPQCDPVPSDSENDWAVLKTTAIQRGTFLAEHNKRLPPHLSPRPLIEVRHGDILITCAGPRSRCGVACLVRDTRPRLMISGKMYRFRVPSDDVDARFVEAYLQTATAHHQIEIMKTGGSDSGLNLTHDRFRTLLVPVAPLNEQRRIVAEIEKHFTRLDAAVASLQRARANLKRYRESVLKAACEGHLVPTEAELARKEDRGYEPASVLLGRILKERRARWEGQEGRRGKYREPQQPDTSNLPLLPEGWLWASFQSFLREPLRNGHSAKASKDGSGVRTLTLTAVTEGNFSEANTKVTTADPEKVRDLWLQPGDIFIERSNTIELVGKAKLFKGKPGFAIFPDLLIRARVVPDISVEYVEVVLRSMFARAYLRSRAQGISGSMPKIDQGTIEELPIPLPPLAEQSRIVAEVERHLSVIRAAENMVEANLRRADRLRQAILKRAFEGKLVPQDPTDEPASVLLERIRKEREPVEAGGPTRRRKGGRRSKTQEVSA